MISEARQKKLDRISELSAKIEPLDALVEERRATRDALLERILRAHPDVSDYRIYKTLGGLPTTISALRNKIHGPRFM